MPEPQILEDAREYLTLLHRRRALILTCVVVCLLTATLYNYTARPLYQATTQLLIDPGTPNIISGRELVPGEGTGSEYYQTQYELLRGRPLLEKAVQRLGPAASAEFARGPLLSPWIRLRRMLSAEGRMAVDARGAPFSPAVEAYRSRLTIQPVAGSRLVNLHFNAYDPELAALAVNALAQLYIEQSLEFRFTTSSEATGWLSERLQEQQKKLEDAEKALQSFREHEGFVAGEERPDVVDQRLVTLTGALMNARTERIAKETAWNRMKGMSGPELLAFSPVAGSPLIQGLRTRIAELAEEEARLAETLGERHPDMVRLRGRRGSLEGQLASEIANVRRAVENDYRTAAEQEASLAAELDSAKRTALVSNRKSIRYGALQAEVETSRQMLKDVSNRTRESGLESQLKSTNVRIVEKAAVPRRPVVPNRSQNYQLGLFIGAFLGIGLAILFERMDNTVKTPDDVTSHLGLPFLGMVPSVNAAAGLSMDGDGTGLPLVAREPQSAAAEAYRVVRTNLIFSSAGSRGRVILFGSAHPGEGKTTTVANLGAALAQNGARVLIVDADLRRPTLHGHFGLAHTPGLSDVIVSKCRPHDVIRATPVEGLHFLPCGYIPPNPTDLLGSESLRDLLAAQKKRFDWILVDAPPILAMADTPVLCPFADGLVLVVWAENSGRPALKRALEQVHRVGGKLTGVVLNKVDLNRNAYYYGQYYGEYYRKYYASDSSSLPPAARPS
jgi:polysaccharide biosynthesis transport protein